MQQNTTQTRQVNVGWLKKVPLLADLKEVELLKVRMIATFVLFLDKYCLCSHQG